MHAYMLCVHIAANTLPLGMACAGGLAGLGLVACMACRPWQGTAVGNSCNTPSLVDHCVSLFFGYAAVQASWACCWCSAQQLALVAGAGACVLSSAPWKRTCSAGGSAAFCCAATLQAGPLTVLYCVAGSCCTRSLPAQQCSLVRCCCACCGVPLCALLHSWFCLCIHSASSTWACGQAGDRCGSALSAPQQAAPA
jgi:hypothetical protein